MSKKETEFDRYDRRKKLEKEAEVQKRKDAVPFETKRDRTKPKINMAVRNWGLSVDEDYEYENFS